MLKDHAKRKKYLYKLDKKIQSKQLMCDRKILEKEDLEKKTIQILETV